MVNALSLAEQDASGATLPIISSVRLENVKIRFTGGKRGWPGDLPLVSYDVSKMRRLGWVTTHTSAEAVRIAARRLIAQRVWRLGRGDAQPASPYGARLE